MPYKRGEKWVAQVRKNAQEKRGDLQDRKRGLELGGRLAKETFRRVGKSGDPHGLLSH